MGSNENSGGLGQLASDPVAQRIESHGEHKLLPDIIESVLPDVVREVMNDRDDLPDGKGVTDQEILQEADWNGANKRRQKWMWMAGDFITRPTGDQIDRFNESADAVAIYMDTCNTASAVTAALRSDTFGSDFTVELPREVLYRAEKRVEERNDVTLEEILQAHREAVDNSEAPI